MPAVRKVSKEQIIDAAVEVLRDDGFSAINARSVAKELGCSTQPIYLSFQNMDDLKAAMTQRAVALHTRHVRNSNSDTQYSCYGMGFVKFAADSFHYLLVSVDTDGNLLSLHETDRTVEPLGEYTSVSRAEADKRLANGEFLTDSYTAEAVDPAAEPEHLANLRLTYVQGSAAYYLPMWEYTIDEGPAALGDGDDVDQTLHTFSAYYVPAVELDGIDVLKNK